MTALLIISVAAAGFLIGWYLREAKIYYDQARKEDRIFRHYQDQAERKK